VRLEELTDEAKMSSSAESFASAWARRKLDRPETAGSAVLEDFLLLPIVLKSWRVVKSENLSEVKLKENAVSLLSEFTNCEVWFSSRMRYRRLREARW